MWPRGKQKAKGQGSRRTKARSGRKERGVEQANRWVLDAKARRVPNFVADATGLDTKKKLLMKFGVNAVFERFNDAVRVFHQYDSTMVYDLRKGRQDRFQKPGTVPGKSRRSRPATHEGSGVVRLSGPEKRQARKDMREAEQIEQGMAELTGRTHRLLKKAKRHAKKKGI